MNTNQNIEINWIHSQLVIKRKRSTSDCERIYVCLWDEAQVFFAIH